MNYWKVSGGDSAVCTACPVRLRFFYDQGLDFSSKQGYQVVEVATNYGKSKHLSECHGATSNVPHRTPRTNLRRATHEQYCRPLPGNFFLLLLSSSLTYRSPSSIIWPQPAPYALFTFTTTNDHDGGQIHRNNTRHVWHTSYRYQFHYHQKGAHVIRPWWFRLYSNIFHRCVGLLDIGLVCVWRHAM